MNIAVLDGHTLNPGDLSWDALGELGDLTLHERTEPADVVERSAGAEVAIINKVVFSREVIDQLPDLKYIGVTATGYNCVDTEYAKERGIPVTNVPVYGTRSVAQMVFAHLLNLTQHVAHHAQTVIDGRWSKCDDFCYWDFPMIELMDMTMGIVGFGRIGRATAELARAFGMKVLAHDAYSQQPMEGVRFVELDQLFRESDVISLHCPLTSENEKMVNAERLVMMKQSAFLINTSRGPLIDEVALADALNEGRLAGAGLDVLTVEPPAPDNPLPTAKNCYVTPHIAWATRSARQRLLDTTVENVAAFQAGAPVNVVNA